MARETGPKCKTCRREGKKLFLRGERCYSPKCAIIKRKYPPGQHGPKGFPRASEYGQQLREKQKLKKTYGILERQLKKYFDKAKKSVGNTEFQLLRLLETRIDSVIFNAGFLSSRNASRQLINHSHILVNGKRMDIPSYAVKIGDEISVKESSKTKKGIQENLTASKGKKRELTWFTIDAKNTTIKIVEYPNDEELPQDIDTRQIIEFYSR